MPEHMNIAIVLERTRSPADQLTTISALATAFARFFWRTPGGLPHQLRDRGVGVARSADA